MIRHSAIRRLPETVVNRIAAGEVIERPASAVKELVENSIDAGARHIEVTVRDGGKSLIMVADDGSGMTRDELELCGRTPCHLEASRRRSVRHRHSRLPRRGPAVDRRSRPLSITSRSAGGDDSAWTLTLEGGRKAGRCPPAHPAGTRVEVRDLFFATPARLKFLRMDRTETQQIGEAISRLAMAQPDIGFTFTDDDAHPPPARRDAGRPAGKPPRTARRGHGARISRPTRLPVDAEREGIRLTGYAGLPTLNRANAAMQYLFVNGRPVRDRLLLGAVRGAYADFLARDRHPLVALFLDIDAHAVDVNVHPAKAEVRFRDAGLVRGLIVGALQHALAAAGHRASTTVASAALGAIRGMGDGRGLPARAAGSRLLPPVAGQPAMSRPGSPNRPRRSSRRSPTALDLPPARAGADAAPDIDIEAIRRLSARRGAGAVARHLYRRPDRATASSSSTSTRRMSAWSTSA